MVYKVCFDANDIDNVFWLTEDEGWINYNFTHDACKKGLSANDEELKGNQLLASLSGLIKKRG